MGNRTFLQNTEEFYRNYFSQVTYGEHSSQSGRSKTQFQNTVKTKLEALVYANLDKASRKGYLKYKRAEMRGAGDPYSEIANIRERLLKTRLEKKFKPNPEARKLFSAKNGRLITNVSHGIVAFDALREQLEFGFVGDTPVAIRRDSTNLIELYFLWL